MGPKNKARCMSWRSELGGRDGLVRRLLPDIYCKITGGRALTTGDLLVRYYPAKIVSSVDESQPT